MAKISGGVVHMVPRDIREVIESSVKLHTLWEDLTPLARNEWICWVQSVKKEETRVRHIELMKVQLLAGKRRPCCFGGCPHRSK